MSDKKDAPYSEVGDPYNWFQRAVRKNYLAAAEMSTEDNYNQIDGVINNKSPKRSVLDDLRQCQQDSVTVPAKPHHEPER